MPMLKAAAARPPRPARAAGAGGGHARHAARIRRGRARGAAVGGARPSQPRLPAGPRRRSDREQALIDEILAEGPGISDAHGLARCRVELANYFAAAVLMPYGPYLAEALASKYDFDHLATRFGVSFEQACHRATTLQRSPARRGCRSSSCASTRPATSRNASTPPISTLPNTAAPARGSTCTPPSACPGGSCRNSWRCRTPASSSSSPAPWTAPVTRHAQDVRLAVAMGCAVEHIDRIGYAEDFAASPAHPTPIGINCRICPRELRPARPQRHGPERTAGRTPARHHALRKLSRRRVSTRGRHVTPCGVSSHPHSD
jgi:hypothetical protein